MRDEIRQPSEPSLDGLRARVLARLEEAYLAAMAAFERSREATTRVRTRADHRGETDETTTEIRSVPAGDVRFLQQALQALEATRHLMGLDAPLRAAHAHLVAIQARIPGSEAIAAEGQPRPAIEAQGTRAAHGQQND